MKTLAVDRYTPESLEKLRLSPGFSVQKSTQLQPSSEELLGVEALLIRSRTKVDEKLLDRAPQLKIVITATSGFDHIDLAACAARKVKVSYTPNANAQSAAELALLLTLGGLRRLSEIEKLKAKKLWKDHLSPGSELFGKTVGIIGFGRVAKAYAKILKAFNCQIIAHDPYVGPELMLEHHVQKTNLTGVLKESDIISLHMSLTPETKGLMSASNFDEINTEALLVNTSRGQVINEVDLIDALNHGHLRGAALDVFQQEPLPQDSPILQHKQIYWTPHVGAMTEEALKKASDEAVHKLIRFHTSAQIDDLLGSS